MTVVYRADDTVPPAVSPMDPESVEVFRFDWAAWLTDIGEADIDESTWLVSAGLVVGDGVTGVTKRGKTITPAAPQIATTETLAHVWVDTAAVNSWASVTNHVRAGSQMLECTARFQIRER